MSPVAGWYADPSTAGTLRYWSGQAWTAHTSPELHPAMFAAPAPAPSWGAPSWGTQPDPLTNPAAAQRSASTGRNTTLVALGAVLVVLAVVISLEVSHVLKVRQQNKAADAADAQVNEPLLVPNVAPTTPAPTQQLPSGIAGLSLDPQSQAIAPLLTSAAGAELSRGGSSITLGNYQTQSGESKVSVEMIDPAAVTSDTSPAKLMSELEAGFEGTVRAPVGTTLHPDWSRVEVPDATILVECESVIDWNIPVRACAFVDGATIGIIAENHPLPGEDPLPDEVRRAITAS